MKSIILLAIASAGALAMEVIAQDYPSRPIRLIVPYTPGGPTDIHSRIVGKKLNEAWGQPVVIENRPGAAGMIGTEIAAKAAPDGYTLCTAGLTFSTAASLNPKLPFDPLRDFAPVALMGSVSNVLTVHPSLPVRSVKELIATARARPGEILFATGGVGGGQSLAGALFQHQSGTKLVPVQYRGSAPGLVALVSGEVALGFTDMIITVPHAKAGKLRMLAVTAGKRSPILPDLPTVTESGLPGFAVTAWFGLVTPAGTPPSIVSKLNGEILKALQRPDIRDHLTGMGSEPGTLTASGFARFLKAESDKWARVIEAAGMRK